MFPFFYEKLSKTSLNRFLDTSLLDEDLYTLYILLVIENFQFLQVNFSHSSSVHCLQNQFEFRLLNENNLGGEV